MSDSDDDDILSDDEQEEEEPSSRKRKAPPSDKSRMKRFIDDSAEHSGEEDGSDEDEEDSQQDVDENDYEKDGFVVGEDEEEDEKKAPRDVLEDSDEEEDEDDEEAPLKKRRVQKLTRAPQLDEDDLALIQEATQGERDRQLLLEERARQEARRKQAIRAQNEAELQKGLFYDSDDAAGGGDTQRVQQQQQQQRMVERYDEDGMDDFIDDDIGDQGDIMASERGQFRPTDEQGRTGVSEAQLTEASEIFGTDYLDFMGQQQQEEDDDEDIMGYRERGVGVNLGVDSDEDDFMSEDDDDEDLFGDDHDDDEEAGGQTARQRAEALKLKREKREMAKAERRRQVQLKRTEKRKARLRRAFEPVQLVENFCTDKDDEIRMADVPERLFDWKTPFHGATTKEFSDEEQEEAVWIMTRIPDVHFEFFTPPPDVSPDDDLEAILQERQTAVTDSIIYALRFMHTEKFEPDFIKRYRADWITSTAVRDNLYAVMDEDGKWDQMIHARDKVETILTKISKSTKVEEETGTEQEDLVKLREDLQTAQAKLDETLKQEGDVKEKLEEFADIVAKPKNDDDDEDLFGNDDDDEEEEEDEAKKARRKEKETIESHLTTVQSLLQERAERVAHIASSLKTTEARVTQGLENEGPALQISKMMCRPFLYNEGDYDQYLMGLSDTRNILDMNSYLSLVKEGNDAIRQKEAPGTELGGDGRKRSRRFNRDYYRTCVADGLRAICYQFMLAPFRAGIKLEDLVTTGSFNYEKGLVGEDGDGDPLKWVAPVISDTTPTEFANKLIGSGDLVLLSSQGAGTEDVGSKDPLRGCRYVAAMELAHEPRIRRYLRNIFREQAVVTTVPTKKGFEEIDAFSEYYGLHLIREKPVKEHFPVDEKETEKRTANLGFREKMEFDAEMKKQEKNSCLQYLNILKAEQTGNISVTIHMPLSFPLEGAWYKDGPEKIRSKENQDLSSLVHELEKIYMPLDGDTEEWNEERRKTIRFALTNFLLPQFEAEARREMREASIKVGVMAAAENLQTMAMEGPLRPASMLGENRFLHPTGDLPFVGVCCSSDGRDATYLASVTDQGELNDQLAIPSGNRVDDSKMRDKVITFLMQSRPSAIAVGTGGGMQSRALSRSLGDLVAEATDRWSKRFIQRDDEDDEEFEARRAMFLDIDPGMDDEDEAESQWKCNVELVDDSVAQLFGRSVRGKKEFPDMDVNLKCAIATARQAKDPLAELTYAWNVASDAGQFGTEMLYLNIHPVQRLLPKTLLLRQYERVLCGVVANVGVDINTSCAHDHLLGLLSFVPGLGPRKAANLKQNVVRIGGVVSSRRELLAKRLMGPVVYNNAVAFIRIREIEQLTDQFLHPLDNTRLHPDVYHRNNWALKIAIDALERLDDDGEKGADKDAIAIRALQDVMDNSTEEIMRLYDDTKNEYERLYSGPWNGSGWDPKVNVPPEMWRDRVEELDLEAFADMLADNGSGRWLSHLRMIKSEFRQPFVDPRKPMEPLKHDKLFQLLTGETDQTLRPGKEVSGKVTANQEFGSRVKIEGEVPAFIPLRNMADDHVESADDVLTKYSIVTAIVTEVKKDHISVDLSLRMEDFRQPETSWERPASLPPLDVHFDRSAAGRLCSEKTREREARLEALRLSMAATKIGADEDGKATKSAGRVTRRACAHPAFRNAKHSEVDRELREAGDAMVGEALIRPSSKSSDSLAIHWVVRPGVIKVFEIEEEDKDTDASIGNVLKIKDQAYGSIDELLGRNISPMNDFVEELTSHRKFVEITEDELDAKLKEQKEANPKGVFYNLCWNELYPGYASLHFITGSTPRSHHIGIAWNGFTWNSKLYSNLDKLLNDFKKNPRGPSSSRSVASETSSLPSTSVPSTVGDLGAKPSRWGAKRAAAPVAPSAPPTNWTQSTPVPVAAAQVWNQLPPPPTNAQPPNLPPLPNNFQPQPPSMPPPPPGNFRPPPPSGPPPSGPPPSGPPPPAFGQPPPPPSGPPPPAFRQPRGVSNLPAWMTQGKT